MAQSLLLHVHDCPRCGVSLQAADQLAEEDINALPRNKQFMAEVKRTRSLPHHRLLFSLLRKVAKSTPTPLSETALLQWVKVRTGHVDILPLGFGKVYEAPASISFAEMDQAQFREFFDRVVNLILTEVAPGLPDTFADEFMAMLSDHGEGGGEAKNLSVEAA
jgi:hypothetical protein